MTLWHVKKVMSCHIRGHVTIIKLKLLNTDLKISYNRWLKKKKHEEELKLAAKKKKKQKPKLKRKEQPPLNSHKIR